MEGPNDGDWLGLVPCGENRWRFELSEGLSRMDGKLYGGTAVAAVVATMEMATGRSAVWATAQFSATAGPGATLDCQVEVAAAGRRTSQARVECREGGRLVFSGLGAAADAGDGRHDAQFASMPEVPAPSGCPPWEPWIRRESGSDGAGWLAISDVRQTSSGCSWLRLRDRPLTKAAVAFLADIVPSGVVRAAGLTGAGTSLDNTVRFGSPPDCDWMLLEVDPYLIRAGYVHGGARLWAEEGTLLGMASQTASALIFDG